MVIASMRLQRISAGKMERGRERRGAEIQTFLASFKRSLITNPLQNYQQGVIKGAESNELHADIARSILFV